MHCLRSAEGDGRWGERLRPPGRLWWSRCRFPCAGDAGGSRCGDQGGRDTEEGEGRAGEHFGLCGVLNEGVRMNVENEGETGRQYTKMSLGSWAYSYRLDISAVSW